ncbi:MAG: 8-amino-7-oxononanoate synthase [Mariprofundales bacterium]
MPNCSNWFSPQAADGQRFLHPVQRHGVIITTANGSKLINFSSNDYLGLAQEAKVIHYAANVLHEDGFGSTASRMVCGDHPLLHNFEHEMAAWLHAESCLLLGSGMLLNMGLLPALADRHSLVVCDKLVHASLLDGIKLSAASFKRFRHLDTSHADSLLSSLSSVSSISQTKPQQRKIIVSDGVFSMDGDCADVAGLLSVADKHDAILILDDAHGIGVLGEQGKGCAETMLQHERLLLCGTLGKAFGGYGAFVVGSENMIDGLRQRMRTLIYSTALPPCFAAAASTALDFIKQGILQQRLTENIKYFIDLTQNMPRLSSQTAIQGIVFGSNKAAMQASASLKAQGFFVPAIRPPTVPKNQARLRITISAIHSKDNISALVAALKNL